MEGVYQKSMLTPQQNKNENVKRDIHGRQRQIQFYEEGGAPPVTALSVSLLKK